MKAPASRFQAAPRNIHTHNPLERLIVQQGFKQLSLAATKIDDGFGVHCSKRSQHCADALLPQPDGRFDFEFFVSARLLDRFGIGRILISQARQCVAGEPPVVPEISRGDGFALRVRRQPAFPFAQQLLDFIVADPVVLLSIQHRDKDINMGQQILQPFPTADPDRIVEPVTPFRKMFVKRVLLGRDTVPERLEQRVDEFLAGAARRYSDDGAPVEFGAGELLAFLAAARHRRPEHPRNGNTQE